jgi:hypothetical protein
LYQDDIPFYLRLPFPPFWLERVHPFTVFKECHHGTILFFSGLESQLTEAVNIQQEEQATSDYLLKVFRASIPHMPKTAAKFGHELQLALQPMIIKPSGGGFQVGA